MPQSTTLAIGAALVLGVAITFGTRVGFQSAYAASTDHVLSSTSPNLQFLADALLTGQQQTSPPSNRERTRLLVATQGAEQAIAPLASMPRLEATFVAVPTSQDLQSARNLTAELQEMERTLSANESQTQLAYRVNRVLLAAGATSSRLTLAQSTRTQVHTVWLQDAAADMLSADASLQPQVDAPTLLQQIATLNPDGADALGARAQSLHTSVQGAQSVLRAIPLPPELTDARATYLDALSHADRASQIMTTALSSSPPDPASLQSASDELNAFAGGRSAALAEISVASDPNQAS